jgi:phosphatidylserine decarboxylase
MKAQHIAVAFIVVVVLFLIFFNREPHIKKIADGLTSPAYGTVYKVSTDGDKTTICIVLDVFDIHMQYYPIDGKVLSHTYDRTGKFNLIFNLNKSAENEKLITLMNDVDGHEISITQIAGLVTRRIVWYDKVNKDIDKGDKLGRILLGSRVDITFPSVYEVKVKESQYVYGPESTLAELKK